MRVALVIERFEAAGGGGEQVAWNVARELVRSGDEVHVLCRCGTDAPGLTVTRLATPSFWQPLRVRTFARRVKRALADHNYDAVHSFSRTLGQDIFHVGGGCHAQYMQKAYSRSGALLRRLSPRHQTLLSLESRIFADPKLVAQCVSHRVQREIAGRHGVPLSRLPVVHCGVDVERFAPKSDASARLEVRKELGVDRQTAWLFAGSGWQRKGLDRAITALANVRDRSTQLWVAGKDSQTKWRARAAREGVDGRVLFLGERSDLERVYAAADGLLMPSRYDAFGLVCLEAAAAGLPVIVSAQTGASELFGDCGRVIEHDDDPMAYAHAMDELASSESREQLGALAHTMASQHDWSAHVARLRVLYKGVVR
ncbi:MAG: UDP-glucose:(heptosyl)LPS alpha-1,3-glucosyltransferase [Myxococcota bacterium]|jgi:UDP-glucose:(heptosyl)LPS alpha-1,3-glucosyltransferase